METNTSRMTIDLSFIQKLLYTLNSAKVSEIFVKTNASYFKHIYESKWLRALIIGKGSVTAILL